MPLDIVRSVVFMAFAAAGVSGSIGRNDQLTAELKSYLGSEDGTDRGFFPRFNSDPDHQLIGGDWSVVWGPVAVVPPGKDEPDYVANAMYVAYSPSQNTYVLAVAGTAHHSFFDWAVEDADVTWLNTVRWSKWVPGAPHDALISGGTDDGLGNLLDREAPCRGRPDKVTVRTFLKGVHPVGRLIVTGHSLGGALSPAMALMFHDELRESGWSDIRVLPLAGPTPGDRGFAEIFMKTFHPEWETTTPDFYWNCDIQNVHDLVPRAWDRLRTVLQPSHAVTDAETAGRHPSIWGDMTGEVALGLRAFVDLLSALAVGVSYTPLNPMRFDDTFGHFEKGTNRWISWSTPPDGFPIGSMDELSKLILASHYDQYIRHFGLIPLTGTAFG